MAKQPIYFTFRVTRNNFPRFGRRWEQASREALVVAGRAGKAEAKRVLAAKQKNPGTGQTQRSIGFTVSRHIVGITVGTLKGVFVERGTKARTGPRGIGPKYGYLKAGARVAVRTMPAVIRTRMRRGI